MDEKEKASSCITPKKTVAISPSVATSAESAIEQTAPNILVYKKMEAIVERMQAENGGVSVGTVKSFMTKIPSVFSGWENEQHGDLFAID